MQKTKKVCANRILNIKIERNKFVKKKKEKKTEHTRMYVQLCSSVSAIFTSVVVYSRTTSPKNNKPNISVFIKKAGIVIWFVECL